MNPGRLLYQDKGYLLQHLHPAAALSWLGVQVVLALLWQHPLFLLSLLLLSAVTMVSIDALAGWEEYLKAGLLMSGLIVLINLLTVRSGATVLWLSPAFPVIGPIAVSLESLTYAAVMSLRLLIVISVFAAVNLLIHPDRLLRLFPPGSRSGLLLSLALRFFPQILLQYQRIRDAAQTRGIAVQAGGFRRRLQAQSWLVQGLLLSALDGALDTAESMSARGFGSGGCSRWQPYRWRLRDWLCLSSSLLALSVGGVAEYLGASSFAFYPTLTPLWNGPQTPLTLGMITLLIMLPLVLNRGCRLFPAMQSKI